MLIQDSLTNLEVSWVAVVLYRPKQALIWAEKHFNSCVNSGIIQERRAMPFYISSSAVTLVSAVATSLFLVLFCFFIRDWDTGAIGAIKTRKEPLVACKPLPNTGRGWHGPECHGTEELKIAAQGSSDQVSVGEAVPLDTACSNKMGEGLSLKSAVTE